MPTLDEFRREMLQKLPLGPNAGLGEAYDIDSLATTSVTVNALRLGTWSAQAFADTFLYRPDASDTADRQRVCSGFTSSTGVLTHAGTNYADTTATDEVLEVLSYRVELFNAAIQEALRRTVRLDRYMLPTQFSMKQYWLGDLTWLSSPGDVERVEHSTNPVGTNNRYMHKWNSVDTSGNLRADNWALSGSGATYARSTTSRRGAYSVAITRAGTDCTFSQNMGLLDNGVSGDSLRGKSVTGVLVAQSSVASQVRVQVYDGVDTSSSSYHTGGGGWEELEIAHSVNAAATECTVRVSVESDNTVVYVDECYMLVEQSSNRDDVRRDSFPEREVPYEFDQGAGALRLIVPELGTPGQVIIYSSRPYPTFDAARVRAGNAESDESDAPLDTIASGAIHLLYRALWEQEGPDRKRFWQLSEIWRRKWETLALDNTYTNQGDQRGFGLPLISATHWPRALRRR